MLYKEIIAVCVILLVYILKSELFNSDTVDEATISSNGQACALFGIVLCGQILQCCNCSKQSIVTWQQPIYSLLRRYGFNHPPYAYNLINRISM
jgi:hypothetical protein